MQYTGEIVALVVSVLWTASAVFFETASKRMGSVALNFIRLIITIILIGCLTTVTKGLFLPFDAGERQLLWLSLSGFVGLFLGDLCLFKSYAMIGARMSQLVLSMSPVMTAIFGMAALGEHLDGKEWCGIMIVTAGVLMAMLGKQGEKIRLNVPAKGLLLAMCAMLAQAAGYIFTKKGIGDYDVFSGSQIRAIIALACFALLITFRGTWKSTLRMAKDKSNMRNTFLGSVCGPFLGISLSLYAIGHASTGIAASLMALVPVFIIVPSVLIKKEKVSALQVVGTVTSFLGGVLFFI